jgi:hypothetical protein
VRPKRVGALLAALALAVGVAACGSNSSSGSSGNASGGGFGDPLERDPERVRADVRDGYVSLAAAERDYGVVLDPDTLAVVELRR